MWKSLEWFLRFTKVVFTDRQADCPIFYKVKTYLDCLLVPEIYVIPNFVKIVGVVLEIYESSVHEQIDYMIFYKVEIYPDHLLVPEMYVILNFVKIVRMVHEIYKSCIHV